MNYSLIECPTCTFNRNAFNAKACELCETPLVKSLSTQLRVKKSYSFDAIKAIPDARDSLRNMTVRVSRLSQSYAHDASVSLLSTARSAATHLRHKISKHRHQDVEAISHSDPWLSDSFPSDSHISKLSSKNKTQPTDFVVLKQTGDISDRVFDRFTSPKNLAFAKTLLILAAMFGVSSVTTVFIFNRYSREQSVSQQQPPSTYSDIKLYETMKAVPNVPKGLFSYGGALCFAALQRDGMNAAIGNAHPSFGLRYVEPRASNPGCTTGIRMLLDGELSIAQNSRPLTAAEVDIASSRGYELESVPVAIDGIVFYTNKSLGIKSLSLEQIKDIYLGKITNWKEIGGKDLPITPVGLDPKIDSILRLVMETENAPTTGKNVTIARDFTSAIRQTSSTPGAISYASSAVLKGQSSILPIALSANADSPSVSAILADGMVNLQAFEKNVYPLTRRLFVVIRRDGSPEEKAGVAYTNFLLSEEGQKIVKRAGFVPLFSDASSKP